MNETTQISYSNGIDAAEWFVTNMESWYNALSHVTMKTHFIAMSQEEMEVLVELNEFNLEKQDDNSKHLQILSDLKTRVDNVIHQFDPSGVFIKLSCRSAKDATVTCDKMMKIYEQKMRELGEEEQLSHNNRVILLNYAYLKALQVYSSEEAFEYFLKSQRILQDLQLAINNNYEYPMQIIIREWKEIPLKHEFRGFVYNGKLTGLSQYFDVCYFEDLATRSEEKKRILQEIETVYQKDVFPNICNLVQNFIIDFAITEEGQVLVIELNPWNTCTDSCLFSWKHDLDLLMNQPNTNSVEFRIRDKPIRNLKHSVIGPWQQLLTVNTNTTR